jgi:hypothetical protein
MALTYEPIATTTLATATSSFTFSSIPATYTDLRLVIGWVSGTNPRIRFNSDTATNYSNTTMYGDSTSATSYAQNTMDGLNIYAYGVSTQPPFYTLDLFSYAGSTYKTCLVTGSEDKVGSGAAVRQVGLWRSTAAVTSLTVFGSGNFSVGTNATLYGILKA